MKILVCGSRQWTDVLMMSYIIRILMPRLIIHGGAPGADTMADSIAEQQNIPVRVFPAQWNLYGKRAGFLRNTQMLDEKPDLVLAFCLDESKGTMHTITEARKRGIETYALHRYSRRDT